jgi:hypothetical protein
LHTLGLIGLWQAVVKRGLPGMFSWNNPALRIDSHERGQPYVRARLRNRRREELGHVATKLGAIFENACGVVDDGCSVELCMEERS